MDENRRYSVTLPPAFQKGLKELIQRGLFIDDQDVIRESLRNTFEQYGVEEFPKVDKCATS